MITRRQYMDHEFTHEEYYGQFATPAVQNLVARNVGKDTLRRSTDPYLNDIPLQRWDALAALLPSSVVSAIMDANESTHGGKRAISLSDKVCVLKAAARCLLEAASGDES